MSYSAAAAAAAAASSSSLSSSSSVYASDVQLSYRSPAQSSYGAGAEPSYALNLTGPVRQRSLLSTTCVYSPERNIKALSHAVVQQGVCAIEEKLKEVEGGIGEIEQGLWFHKADSTKFDSMRLMLIKYLSEISGQSSKLIDKRFEVSAVSETIFIDDIVAAIQELEILIADLQRRVERAKQVVDSDSYQVECSFWKNLQTEFATAIGDTGTIDSQIEKVERLWGRIEQAQSKTSSTCSTIVNTRICTAALPLSLIKRIEVICLTTPGSNNDEVARRCNSLRTRVLARLSVSRQVTEPAVNAVFGSALPKEGALEAYSNEVSLSGNFDFAPTWGEWTMSWLRRDPNTEAKKIAENLKLVARALVGLRQDINLRITAIAKGVCTPSTGHASLKDEKDFYTSLAKKCSVMIEAFVADLTNVAASDKVPEVYNYAAGLKNCLADICDSLEMLTCMCSDASISLAKAQNELMLYLNETTGRFPLFFAAHGLYNFSRMENAHRIRPHTVNMLRETIATKGPQGLILTDEEMDVWPRVFSLNSRDKCQIPRGEGAGSLRSEIVSFIEKRICHLMYFPLEVFSYAPIDPMELELVLYSVRKSPGFTKTFAEDSDFRQMLDAYANSDIKLAVGCSSDVLESAKNVCVFANRASDPNNLKNAFDYARAWQAYHEFLSLCKDHIDGKDKLDKMAAFIYSKLRNASAACGHVLPTDQAQNEELSVLAVMSSIPDTIRLYQADERQGMFFRALVSAIYATKSDEKSQSEKIVRAYLNQDDVFFDSLLDDPNIIHNRYSSFIDLICEHVLQQVLEYKFGDLSDGMPKIANRGLDLFVQGSVKKYCEDKNSSLLDPRLPFAIANLINYEKGLPERMQIVTKMFMQAFSRQELESFVAAVETYNQHAPHAF